MLSPKSIFITALLTGITAIASAQAQDARIPKVVPPAPDAAALQKFGDIPISAYTGTPNISIPLYELKSGDISVPISISYNASGIRVADEATRVGLGWVLNAGGAISRTIIGRDDWDDYQLQTFGDIPAGPKVNQGFAFNYIDDCLMSINGYSLPQVLLNDYLTDFQPDQYSYSFNGQSGRFMLRRDESVVLNKIEKIDVKLTDLVNATGWEIKTADGFVYRFEDIETFIDGSQNRKSSWYLTKITSPTGRIVQFFYTTLIQNIQPAGSYFESLAVGYPTTLCDVNPATPPPYSAIVPGHTYHSLYISKITSDQCEVKFSYLPGRLDIANEVQLDSVNIYSKKFGVTNNELLKSWKLNYGYFSGSSINGWSNPTNPDLLFKRLKLTSIKEVSGASSIPPYLFTYNNETDPTGNLPSKLSFARDHWGYFNGKLGNTTLIPTYYGTTLDVPNPGLMGNERSTDPTKSQLFLLNKIQYPTGGSTKFDYESNDYDQPNSSVNDYTYWAGLLGVIPTNSQTSFSSISAGGTFSGSIDLSNMYPYAQYVTVEASFIKTAGIDVNTVNQINYSLKNAAGFELGTGIVGSYLGSPSPPMTVYLGTQQSNSGVKMTLIKSMSPGIYTWSFTVPSGLTAASVVVTYLKGEGLDPIINGSETLYNAVFGGGVRILRITDYTDATTVAKVRRYNYHYQLNGKTYSYGRRMTKPNYSYYVLQAGGSRGAVACRADCLMRESDSNIPLNGSSGSTAVGYDKVEELQGENGENGKTLFEYRNQPDVMLDFRRVMELGSVPLKPPPGSSLSDQGNGELLKQTVYTKINGDYFKSRVDSNVYQDISDNSHDIIYGIDKRSNDQQAQPPAGCGYISFFTYPAITINRFVLLSSTNKIYDESGLTLPIISTTEYTYNNTTHLQLISKANYKSNGDKITTKYTYPLDYSDAQSDAAILLMKNAAYMHALPVTQQLIITQGANQLLTEAQINKYQVISSKVFMKEKAILENSQPININTPPTAYNPASGPYPSGYVARLFFDSYSTDGNITQVHQSDNIYTSYIWDYLGNYPIAEVTNAGTAICAYTGFESNGNGNWTYTGTASSSSFFTGDRSYVLNGSGTNITKSGLDGTKTYIVSYWSKSGSATVNGSTASAGIIRGLWTYYEHTLAASTTSITITGTNITIDDLRLFPKGALMTTYNYNPLKGMTSQSDPNYRITFYEYDEFQRLKIIRDQDGNILKTIEYKYKL